MANDPNTDLLQSIETAVVDLADAMARRDDAAVARIEAAVKAMRIEPRVEAHSMMAAPIVPPAAVTLPPMQPTINVPKQEAPVVNFHPPKQWTKLKVTAHKDPLTGSIESFEIERIA